MAKEYIQKTVFFNIDSGHYKCLRCTFGLKNIPTIFQTVMDNILRSLQNLKFSVYMADIIIFNDG